MTARSTRTAGLALAALLSTALAACGSSGTSTSSSGSSSATSSTSSAAIDNALAVTFAGGTAGQKADSSKSPISIGTINMEGGTVSDPEARIAMQAAFDYVNAELGGIGGHPVKLVSCAAANTEEDVQKCAQQMLNDKSVSVVVEGGLNVGTQVVHAVLGNSKPVIEAESNPGPDTTAANAFSLNASAVAIVNGFGAYAKHVNAKTLAMVGGNGTGDVAIGNAVKGALERSGVKVKYVTFGENSTDLLTPLTAAGATSSDAVVPAVVQAPQCVSAAKTLSQLGVSKNIIGVGLCASTAVKSQLGDFPKWTYLNTILQVGADDPSGQTALYQAVMDKYAPKNAEQGLNAPYSFGAALSAVKVLNTVGADKVTPQTVASALPTFTGPVLLGPPTLKFGSVPGMPALGSVASRAYTYQGGGKFVAASDWIS